MTPVFRRIALACTTIATLAPHTSAHDERDCKCAGATSPAKQALGQFASLQSVLLSSPSLALDAVANAAEPAQSSPSRNCDCVELVDALTRFLAQAQQSPSVAPSPAAKKVDVEASKKAEGKVETPSKQTAEPKKPDFSRTTKRTIEVYEQGDGSLVVPPQKRQAKKTEEASAAEGTVTPDEADANADGANTDGANTDEPNADVPNADVPNADVPNADVPNADVPNADVPNADVPNADVPNADVPNADEPDADSSDANGSDAGGETPGGENLALFRFVGHQAPVADPTANAELVSPHALAKKLKQYQTSKKQIRDFAALSTELAKDYFEAEQYLKTAEDAWKKKDIVTSSVFDQPAHFPDSAFPYASHKSLVVREGMRFASTGHGKWELQIPIIRSQSNVELHLQLRFVTPDSRLHTITLKPICIAAGEQCGFDQCQQSGNCTADNQDDCSSTVRLTGYSHALDQANGCFTSVERTGYAVYGDSFANNPVVNVSFN